MKTLFLLMCEHYKMDSNHKLFIGMDEALSQLQIFLFAFVLIMLILLAAFFSFAETSLMAVNRYKLRHQARMKKGYAMGLLHLLKRPDRVLSAILIGNTFANMIASSLATLIAYHFWGDKGALLAAMVLTFIVLIFTEIIPKTIAAIYSDKVSRLVYYPIKVLLVIMHPVVWLANKITSGFLKLLRINVARNAIESLSREELRSVVYDTKGKMSREYHHMLLSILDLGKLTVEDVMVPRHEITGINLNKTWAEIVTSIIEHHEEYIPVYQGTINDIRGVLYVHDVLSALLNQTILNKETLHKYIQEPYFVPEGTSLSTQMGYFQQNHTKIAFVVDEYGEIQGLLTLREILEEIVGDFTQGVAGKRMQLQPDESYLVDGSVSIREFNRFTEWELPVNGPRTVNGLIVEYLESLPHAGTAVLIAGYPIEIVQVRQNRVKLAKIFPRLESHH